MPLVTIRIARRDEPTTAEQKAELIAGVTDAESGAEATGGVAAVDHDRAAGAGAEVGDPRGGQVGDGVRRERGPERVVGRAVGVAAGNRPAGGRRQRNEQHRRERT